MPPSKPIHGGPGGNLSNASHIALAHGMNRSLADAFCEADFRWHYFLASSLVCLASGIASVLLFRVAVHLYAWARTRLSRRQLLLHLHFPHRRLCRRAEPTELQDDWRRRKLVPASTRPGRPALQPPSAVSSHHKPLDELVWPTEWKDLATELISGQRRTGRVLVTFIFSLTIASYGLYIVDANRVKADPLTGGMELCIAFRDSFVQQVDLVFNLFFIGHFVLRLIASSDKLWYWFDIFTLVDLFTIPPAFVGLYFRRVWIGLRFTRILRLLTLADVLQYLNILKTGNTIRLCQLVTMFASLVLTAAGFIHLVENSGDPPEFKNANAITYFECTYMMIVTITTVGFGDLTAQTTSGRVFMILFLLSGLAVFANSVPEIADIVGSRNKYGGVYRKTTGKSHLVLCGHITFSTVNNFLSDFLHEDREDVDTQIVILHKSVPDLELEGTLKRHGTQVFYFQASKHLLFLKL